MRDNEFSSHVGFTMINNHVLEAAIRHNFTSVQHKILLYLFRVTYGWQRKAVKLNSKDAAKETNLNYKLFSRALGQLKDKNVVIQDEGRMVSINENIEEWKPGNYDKKTYKRKQNQENEISNSKNNALPSTSKCQDLPSFDPAKIHSTVDLSTPIIHSTVDLSPPKIHSTVEYCDSKIYSTVDSEIYSTVDFSAPTPYSSKEIKSKEIKKQNIKIKKVSVDSLPQTELPGLRPDTSAALVLESKSQTKQTRNKKQEIHFPFEEISQEWVKVFPRRGKHNKLGPGYTKFLKEFRKRYIDGLTLIHADTGKPLYHDAESAVEWWGRFFRYVRDQNSWLLDKTFFNLDWLVNETNFHKVMNGNFQDKEQFRPERRPYDR